MIRYQIKTLGLAVFCLLLTLVSNLMAQDGQVTTLHVSVDGNDKNSGDAEHPLATIEGAQAKVRKLIASDLKTDIHVLIEGGTYILTKPLLFGPDDAFPADRIVRYAAVDGKTAILSGGTPISDWSAQSDGTYTTNLPDDVPRNGALRQLFGDDQTLHRARTPNGDYFRITAAGEDHRTSFQFDENQWKPSEHIVGAEVALLHDWSMSRVTIQSVAPDWILLSHRVGAPHDFFRIDGFETTPRFFVEGALEFLDSKNEFFHDSLRHQLIVHGQTELDAIWVVPRLTELLRIEGTLERPVKGLIFEGLQFCHTRCDIPPSGYAGIQASFFETRAEGGDANDAVDPATESGHSRLPSAVSCKFVDGLTMRNCRWKQLGGGGIYLDRQTNFVEIDQCLLDDIGGCGIMIGETITRVGEQGDSWVCHHNTVRRTHVQRCGQILFGSVGIWIGIAQNTLIAETELHDLPYSGVSVGWRWDDQPSGCQDNRIVGNHIHHVMQVLSDGGGIYTLGRQPGTVLQQNYIHDIPLNSGRAQSNGIFMDEGSTEILVAENRISQTANSPIRFHKVGHNTIRNNNLTHTPGTEPFTYNAVDPSVLEMIDNEIQNSNERPNK